MIKAIRFLAELVYDIATINSHPTGHPNFDNEESKRNWRESQKPTLRDRKPITPPTGRWIITDDA